MSPILIKLDQLLYVSASGLSGTVHTIDGDRITLQIRRVKLNSWGSRVDGGSYLASYNASELQETYPQRAAEFEADSIPF